ncbi:hypothetical protein L7F22_053656 [Adiantum nelumboides]|nr:hypothetical protein [Adiantum nelumboides]
MIEAQARYIVDTLRRVHRRGADSVEVRPEVEQSFNDWLDGRMVDTVWQTGGCRSWYQDPPLRAKHGPLAGHHDRILAPHPPIPTLRLHRSGPTRDPVPPRRRDRGRHRRRERNRRRPCPELAAAGAQAVVIADRTAPVPGSSPRLFRTGASAPARRRRPSRRSGVDPAHRDHPWTHRHLVRQRRCGHRHRSR